MNNKRRLHQQRGAAGRRGTGTGVRHRTIIVFESRTIEPKLVDLTSKHSSTYTYI